MPLAPFPARRACCLSLRLVTPCRNILAAAAGMHQSVAAVSPLTQKGNSTRNKCTGTAASDARTRASITAGEKIRSLREASRNPTSVEVLDLSGSKDFVCTEMVCGGFGGQCVCKLARWIYQTGPMLSNLRSLTLADNKLKTIPDTLWTLTSLEELDLSNNCLTELDSSITNLHRLARLDLSSNQFAEVPHILTSLGPNVEIITDNNPFTSDPQ
eukprot:m.133235 g.133235  ORF g.133235 m.133235 type:complete len:214 (+) comp17532_c0_seq3:174-815(+)